MFANILDTPLKKPCPSASKGYIINDPKNAYWRVLVKNHGSQLTSQSLLGRQGHLERANAWTHLFAFSAFFLYAIMRIPLVDQHSFSSLLQGVACSMFAIMFAASVIYHVYRTVPGCAPIVRSIDIVAIYLAFACAGMADTALLTKDFANAPYQTLADPVLASFVLIFFFSVRRIVVPPEETFETKFEDCTLGLFRFRHSDLEHAGLRLCGVATLSVAWILAVSSAVNNLDSELATIWVFGVAGATFLLICGVLYDNFLITDTVLSNTVKYGNTGNYGNTGKPTTWYICQCYSRELGCVFTSHAMWHILSFLAVILPTVAREIGIVTLHTRLP